MKQCVPSEECMARTFGDLYHYFLLNDLFMNFLGTNPNHFAPNSVAAMY